MEIEIGIKFLSLDLRNKLHGQFDKEFFFFLILSQKESNPSSFFIPSFIDVLMHMMHVRVQKMHVFHLALMYYMWCMIIMSLILALMYENLHVKVQI